MTLAIQNILASDEGALFKLAFWGIIILIFGIVKFVKFINRLFSPTKVAKPSDAPPAMRNTRRAPPPLPSRTPMPAGAIALPPLPTKAGAKVRRKVARKAAPAQAPAVQTNTLGGIIGAVQQTRISQSAPPPIAVSRSRGAGWLDARTIRSHFILSEAMKPPHSLK